MYFAYAKQAFQECEWLAPAVVVGKENCSNCGGETREGNNEDMRPVSGGLLIPGARLWDMNSTGITAVE